MRKPVLRGYCALAPTNMRQLMHTLRKIRRAKSAGKWNIPPLFAAFAPLTGKNNPLFKEAVTAQTTGDLLNSAFTISIILGAMLAVGMLMYHGFRYMTATSGDTKTKAKKGITNVFVGLLLLLTLVIIVEQINPEILKFDLELEAPTQPTN